MELRNLKLDDFDASVDLSQYAFQYSLTAEQREEHRKSFKPEQVWGVFEQNELEAQLTVIPLEMHIQGRKYAMGGIAGVASWPEHRRRGNVAQLLRHVLLHMKENGISVSSLAPFSFGFYKKYGWELYVEYKQYTIETGLFPQRKEIEGKVSREAADIPLLSRLYEAYASRYNGTLHRSEEWWKNTLKNSKKGYTAVYYGQDGEAVGYILYEIKARVLHVHEMVFENEQARQALWTYLASHDSMVEKAVLKAPMDDTLPFLLSNPRIGQEIVSYFMARIVDTEAFVQQYAFAPTAQGTRLTIRLNDPNAPWNEGDWNLSVTADGKGTMEPVKLEEGAQPDLSCDINTWSALMMGYRSASELNRFGRLAGSPEAAEQLHAVIPQRQTYLMDFF
ncbi:GNAT family N-acetyltransferase [Paenibacillus nasutitermitis]|uniref:Acetyltransferase n=1 Tax=Paenibacillus nasutitermitis TaxID=1652958 RepID=A0A917DMU3_9BACL|nr:GNAT family N-acetyltransferase [Paenibacillus nasutitermitis]GGD52591.1 acetyltransferase [Paenibacillus nasutitermitis]